MTKVRDQTVVEVPMPQLGVSVLEGTLLEWRVAVGATVAEDEPLCDVATDKVDSEVPAPVTGVLVEVLVASGETVEVGTPIARIAVGTAAPAGSPPADPAPEDPVPAITGPAHTGPAHTGPADPDPASAPPPRRAQRFSPAVRHLVQQHGLDLADAVGTGRGGRMTRRDVEALLAQADRVPEPDPVPAVPAHPEGPTPAPQAGRTIGYSWVEVDMTRAEAQMRASGASLPALVGVAVAAALRRHPAVNAAAQATVGAAVTGRHDLHLGVVVGLDTGAVVVPVVRTAQDLSEAGLATRITALAARAHAGALAPEETRDATFTIVDGGAAGGALSTPVVRSAQVAALSIGAVARRPVVVAGPDGGDALVIRPVAVLVLAWDGAVLDELTAGRFLAVVRDHLENRPRPAGAVA